MLTILHIVNIAVIIVGAVYDAKYRIIPNMVPITIMLTKTASADNLSEAVFSLLLVAVCLGIAHFVLKQEIPGGDFKLLCSLTFSLGIFKSLICFLLVFVTASIACYLRGEKSFPLCTYTAPFFAAVEVLEIIL